MGRLGSGVLELEARELERDSEFNSISPAVCTGILP